LKLSLIIAAILLIAGVAQASVLTVCPDGCNYTNIQAAVYAAHPNDTIEVQSGTYNESVILTKDISFKGIDTGACPARKLGNFDLIIRLSPMLWTSLDVNAVVAREACPS
jgi:hypothetical protein